MMSTKAPAWIDPERIGHPKPVTWDRLRSLLCLLCLAGAALAFYFLLLRGGYLLLAGLAGQGISNLSQPDMVRPDGMEAMMATGAAMVMSGACLTFGLLALGVRSLSGKPLPGRHTVAWFIGISAILVAASVLSVWHMTAPKPAPPPGLEGVWYDSGHMAYRFNSDGTADGWWSGMPHGKVGTWSRSGRTITFRSDKGWQFVGTLQDGTIRGTSSQASTGAYSTPAVWTRKVRP
jgi:hypothetical protein